VRNHGAIGSAGIYSNVFEQQPDIAGEMFAVNRWYSGSIQGVQLVIPSDTAAGHVIVPRSTVQ
jgi:hypothetical protein